MATEGIVRISQQLPANNRGWEQFLRRLNDALQYDGERAVIAALTTLSTRTGTDLDTLVTLLGDDGKATSQRLMPTLNFANVGSIQSAVPLTATADASTAVVSIAAHNVYIGGETVAYSAGSVVGVPVSTDVFIYADDPDLEGGAVTYEYTTDFIDLAGDKGRYRVGGIRTPVSSISASISAITNANPGEVTTGSAHLFTTGDVIDFSSIGGTTALNSGTYTITVTSSTTFTVGVDTSAMGVYTSGGTATRVTTPAAGIGGAGADGGVYDLGYYYG